MAFHMPYLIFKIEERCPGFKDVFESFMQEDYKTAFQESSHPINFRFGYSNPSNILVSRKKTQ